jgi:hypothetical protein
MSNTTPFGSLNLIPHPGSGQFHEELAAFRFDLFPRNIAIIDHKTEMSRPARSRC